MLPCAALVRTDALRSCLRASRSHRRRICRDSARRAVRIRASRLLARGVAASRARQRLRPLARARAPQPRAARRGRLAPRRRRARLHELGERARLDRGQRAQRRPRARHQPVQGQGGHARRPCAARPRPALQDVFGRRAVRARFLPARASVRAQALRGLLQHGRPRDPKPRRLGARARRHTEELLGLAEQVSGKRRRLGLVHPRGLRRGHRVRPRRLLRRGGPRASAQRAAPRFRIGCGHVRPHVRDERASRARDGAPVRHMARS